MDRVKLLVEANAFKPFVPLSGPTFVKEKSLLGLFVGLLVIGLFFGILERLFPSIRGSKIVRKGFWVDLIYWVTAPFVGKLVTGLAVILPVLALVGLSGISFAEIKTHHYAGYGPLSRLPHWLQGMGVLILGDFIGYWTHRLFHRRTLWPFHAVHHSSEELDWLSYAPFITLYAIFLHANISWTFGPLRYVIATPHFHRWHHTKEIESQDKNFAGFFPIWDLCFGTFYLPKGKAPRDFGVAEKIPENVWRQLLHPFKKRLALPDAAAPRRS